MIKENENIKKILEEYLSYYANEKNNLIQLQGFITNGKNILSRLNTVGHITASGYIYAKEEQKILLLEHKKLNKFLQPGGHVEKEDSSLIETSKREIYEETKLKDLELISISSNKEVPFDINTHYIPENSKDNMPAHYHHDFRYLFMINKIEDVNIDVNESKSYKWIDIQELENNINFKRVIDKIYYILNSNLKIRRYYSKIIEEFNINLKEEYESIVVSHIIPDCLEYLDALNLICPIKCLIPKPNSINKEIYEKIKQKYKIKKIKREDIINDKELDEQIKSGKKKIIIFDIGGYFAEYIKQNSTCKNIQCIIEDTENGYQKYETIHTNIKIISVARSVLKENEDYLVGESVLFSADTILREMGKVIDYMTCGVIGYGKIGNSIAAHLLQKGIKAKVYDINPIKQIEAFNRMCDISRKDEILKNSEVIFLATGNQSLNINDFRKIKKGVYIFSVTSSDDEIDNLYLESEYKIKLIREHIYKYENRCNYFYLIRKGNAVNFIHNAVMDDFIHLVRSEILVASSLSDKDKKYLEKDHNNILEVNIDVKKKIAEIWLNIFQNKRF